MRDLKIFLFALLLMGLEMPLWVWAQEKEPEPTATAEELSLEQFWEELWPAFQANDAVRIHQLITANPTTAERAFETLNPHFLFDNLSIVWV